MLAELPEENNSNNSNNSDNLNNLFGYFGNEGNVEDHSAASLTLEQQFHYVIACSTIDKMNLEQAKDTLKEVYKQMLIRDNLYKHLLKHQWGLA